MRFASHCLLFAAVCVLLLPVGCGGEGASAGGDRGAVPAPDTFEFRNPVLLAKPGHWAEYSRLGNLTERLTVLSTDPSSHAMKIERLTRDTEVNALRANPVLTVHPNQFLFGFEAAGAVVTAVRRDRVDLLGRTFDALVVETVGRFGQHRCWYSEEIPVYGLLLQQRVKPEGVEVMYELLDYSGR